MSRPPRAAAPRGPLFWVLLLAIVAVALWLRLDRLGLKPLHHDESVNGWFTLRLQWWNLYQYRHADYHGPFLYYVNLLFFELLGPSERSLRLGTALAGASLPLALLPMRRRLGDVGTLTAGLLLAVGPGLVYFSRTAIHEIYLVLFTLVWLAGLVRYAEAPSRRAALTAGLGAALSFANKETAVITAFCLAAGAGLAWGFGRPRAGGGEDPDLFGGRDRAAALRSFVASPRDWGAAALVFVGVTVVMFSSVFSWWPGVGNFFMAFVSWTEHGVTGRNQAKPFGYFAEVMAWTEGALPWFAAAAGMAAVSLRHRFGLALTGWALSSLLVYSAIPYKTPWCVLNIDLPIFLLAAWGSGKALEAAAGPLPAAVRAAALLVAPLPALAAIPLVPQVLEVNAERYDDKDVPYVFVQTQRETLELVQDLVGVAAARPDDDGLGLRALNDGAKNPIRFYTITRGWDHERTTYPRGTVRAEDIGEHEVVMADPSERTAVRKAVEEAGGEWHQASYLLRPGVPITTWFRQDLWDAYQAAGGRATVPTLPPPSERIHVPPEPGEEKRGK